MRHEIVIVTPFQQNCTLLWCEHTLKGAVVDPGGDLPMVYAAIEQAGIEIDVVLLTHGHIDHAAGARECADALGVNIVGPHRDDAPLLAELSQQATMFGLPPVKPVEPDRWLDEGDSINLGELRLDVLHTPGHSPGHVAFFDHNASTVQSGDVLFNGSIGRTDLPGGNQQQLLDTIRTKILPLGDDVYFIPGHGPSGTVGHERRTNPFLSMLSG
ncbi:MAG: MBL fold metallo-hydrolase [Pseudomonadota bacterium]